MATICPKRLDEEVLRRFCVYTSLSSNPIMSQFSLLHTLINVYKIHFSTRFDVLRAVSIKAKLFRDLTLSRLVNN